MLRDIIKMLPASIASTSRSQLGLTVRYDSFRNY